MPVGEFRFGIDETKRSDRPSVFETRSICGVELDTRRSPAYYENRAVMLV